MARFFTDTANDIIDCGSDSTIDNIFDGGGTIMIWQKPISDGGANQGAVISKRPSGGANGWFWFLQPEVSADSRLRFLITFDGADGSWQSTDPELDYTVWNHTVLTYDSDLTTNNPSMFFDGISVTITENNTPTGTRNSDAAQEWDIGNRANLALDYDGDLANNVGWSVILSSVEITALSRGINPFVIQHSSQVINNPLNGNNSPEGDYINQTSQGTVTGATKSTTNPPIELIENYL